MIPFGAQTIMGYEITSLGGNADIAGSPKAASLADFGSLMTVNHRASGISSSIALAIPAGHPVRLAIERIKRQKPPGVRLPPVRRQPPNKSMAVGGGVITSVGIAAFVVFLVTMAVATFDPLWLVFIGVGGFFLVITIQETIWQHRSRR